jgi:hypothetical protein
MSVNDSSKKPPSHLKKPPPPYSSPKPSEKNEKKISLNIYTAIAVSRQFQEGGKIP